MQRKRQILSRGKKEKKKRKTPGTYCIHKPGMHDIIQQYLVILIRLPGKKQENKKKTMKKTTINTLRSRVAVQETENHTGT